MARQLHTAASADAALASELRAAYRGRHNVLDALWWRAHPLTATPGGRPDPAAELPRLQAAVYARPGQDGSLAGSERRLRDVLAELRQDETDLDAVLALFPDGALRVSSPGAPHPPGSPAAPSVPGGRGTPGAPSAPSGSGAPLGRSDAGGSAPSALRGPTQWRSVLLVAAGFLVGGIVVATVSALTPHGGPASGPGAEPAASASPGLLALFDQP